MVRLTDHPDNDNGCTDSLTKAISIQCDCVYDIYLIEKRELLELKNTRHSNMTLTFFPIERVEGGAV